MNFTLQDIISSTLAFFLFPLVLVFPGYICSHALNLFDFKSRHIIVKLGIGLILSFSISPIIFDLTSSLFSLNFSALILSGFAIAFLIVIRKEKTTFTLTPSTKTILWICSAWIVFAIISLIDIQWHDQLYLSVLSYDHTTRISIIEAMTRTGVPPINPGYYPGHPVRLTFLYYFWYVLGSLIDLLGGTIVDARAALSASIAWAGLGLIAITAFYLQMRNTNRAEKAWQISKIGVCLLAVSGLDVLLFIISMSNPVKTEQWSTIQFASLVWNNMQFSLLTMIFTWIVSVLFVPHHVAAMIAGLTSMMLVQSARGKTTSRKIVILSVAGLGFASCLGLSVWVTIIFVAFWGIWIITLFLQKTDRNLVFPMILAGLIAILLASPFLLGLLQSGGTTAGQAPIIFEVRSFMLLEPFTKELPLLLRSLIMLVIFPIDYMFELGFFFWAGIYWLRIKSKNKILPNPFYLAEILLLAVVLFTVSFLRSTQLLSNDLGTRAWLPGQFILLIWGVDIVEVLFFTKSGATFTSIKTEHRNLTRYILQILIVLGIFTSAIDSLFLRIFWPGWAGKEFGEQIYSAHLAYDYLRNHIPADTITQNNPEDILDRPSGLYGTHQMAIADRTAFGVPLDVFNKMVSEVAVIFTSQKETDWKKTDAICRQHFIDVLIIKDSDPIWNSLALLKTLRPALYENTHYALFACGDYTINK